MATINVYNGKKGKTYRVQIRRIGQVPLSETFKSLQEAKQWAKIMEAGLSTPHSLLRIKQSLEAVDPATSSIESLYTMNDLIARYRESVMPQMAKTTRRSYPPILKYWEKKLGNFKLTEITPTLISTHRDALLKIYKTGTARGYIARLNTMLNIAVNEYKWLSVNPCSSVRKPRDSKPRVRYLSDEERSRLLMACKASTHRMLYPVVVLSLATGARYSEIMNLKFSEVDLQHRVIYFPQTKNDQPHSVPISEFAVKVLNEYIQIVSSMEDVPWNWRKGNLDRFLFPAQHGDKPTYIVKAWRRARAAAGLKNYHYHDNRHSCASALANNGASLLDIAQVLNHKSIRSTQIYAHLTESRVRNVLEDASKSMFG